MSLKETIETDDWRDVKVQAFEGLNKALDGDNLKPGELIRGENIRLVNDTLTPAIGFDPYNDDADNDAWLGDAYRPFKYRLTDGTLGHVLFTTGGLYRDNGTNWKLVAGGTFTGSLENRFSAVCVPWDDKIVFTNGFDPVQVYNVANGTIAPIEGPESAPNIVCKSLAVYDSSVFMFNTVESGTARPQRMRWCAKGDITDWDDGESGSRDLLESTDPIQCGVPLGSYLIVYRERGIHRCAVSGDTSVRFQIDIMIPDNGVQSIDSVVNVEKNRHFVWGRDNFYLYDGGFELEPIGDEVTKILFEPLIADEADEDPMFAAEEPGTEHTHHIVYLEQLNEMLCVYRSLEDDGLKSALNFRYKESKWFTRKFLIPCRGADISNYPFIHIPWEDLVGAWEDQVGSWDDMVGNRGLPLPIFASTVGGTSEDTPTYKFDVDLVEDDGVPLTIIVETKDFSEYPYHARLDWVDLRINGTESVAVSFSLDEGATWELLRAFDTSGLQVVRLHQQVLYESIRFKLEGADFILKSMNLRVTPEDEIAQVQPDFADPTTPVLALAQTGDVDQNLTMTSVRGSRAVASFNIYRSIDDGDWELLDTQDVETVSGVTYGATYTDLDPLDPETNLTVEYYVVAVDDYENLSLDSNIVLYTVPEPITEEVFDVTIANLGAGAIGYEIGVGGSISPVGGVMSNGAEFTSVWGFLSDGQIEIFIRDELLPAYITQVEFETNHGNMTLLMSELDDSSISQAESYYYWQGLVWYQSAEIGQVRTVTFS